MPADDTMLAQGTVDFRNEGRRQVFACHVDESAGLAFSFCTCDEGCRADAGDHFESCPVDARLRAEFGY